MKATVVEIQSRSYLCNGKPQPHRVIALQFDLGLAQGGNVLLRLPEYYIGIIGLELDNEVDVSFQPIEKSLTALSNEA